MSFFPYLTKYSNGKRVGFKIWFKVIKEFLQYSWIHLSSGANNEECVERFRNKKIDEGVFFKK